MIISHFIEFLFLIKLIYLDSDEEDAEDDEASKPALETEAKDVTEEAANLVNIGGGGFFNVRSKINNYILFICIVIFYVILF